MQRRPTRTALSARFDWSEPPSRVVVTVVPKGAEKTLVSVGHEQLPDAESGDRLKRAWREWLAALKATSSALGRSHGRPFIQARNRRTEMHETDGTTHITEVGTVGIPVSDQDRALEFYVDKLGFEKRMEGQFGEGQRWLEVAPKGALTTIALVRASAENPAGIDTGVRFTTMDAAADHATLRARGVDVDAEVIPYPVAMFVFRDPDGNRLILVERPLEH
jgi:catechol 2,3-dioxygenase-like lactoylglutathione lyase family enzyme